ncbi:CaiF/GrlA family transcriptional regulator [Serratia marcescens]|uniref:CaiF/GrlA family transcriptional regulator n=1 Tax=Serratia marcescens TaxID=615 RepID=UPI003F8316E9
MSRDNHDNINETPSHSRRAYIPARQRNQEGYRLPASLPHLPAMPLYMAVAHFGLQRRKAVSRKEIGEAFNISTRRALEVMRYLMSSNTGITWRRMPPLKNLPRQGYRIRILSIPGVETPPMDDEPGDMTPAYSASRPSPAPGDDTDNSVGHPRSRRVQEEACQSLRRWFLRRPNPEGQ